MAPALSGPAQYLSRFGDQTILCNQYAMTKLGVDKSHCSLKIEDYLILCIPYQIGFKRATFIASLSMQELAFFQRYIGSIVGLTISFIPRNSKSQQPLNFFIRCSLASITLFKDRENTALFELNYKTTPDQLVITLGSYLDSQEMINIQYEEYGKTPIKMTPDVAKMMGYNLFATINTPNAEPRRIQVYLLSSKTIEHLESSGAVRTPGSNVTYKLFFKKFRVSLPGVIQGSTELQNKLIRTISKLSLSPELIEIIDDYWYVARSTQSIRLPQKS